MPGTPPRARDLGIPFDGLPGPLNAITDVPGVQVGYTTLVRGDGPLQLGQGPVRTGVTALLPRGRDGVDRAAAAGWYSLNGNGEMTGTTWIDESGTLTGPVLITNTHAVGACHEGAVRWTVTTRPDSARRWLLPVVAETWDGYLNDVNGGHVTAEHAIEAIEAASAGLPDEGSVGGGTGMTCYGFKAGSGTASRQVEHHGDTLTVGVFVQANFGRRRELRIAGVPVGTLVEAPNPQEDAARLTPPGSGSVIVVVATDAPLLPGQCKALARRVPLGLARTGTTGSHFSGDIFLAFSTADVGPTSSATVASDGPAYESTRYVPWGSIDPIYEATVQAVEEAVVNALVAGRTVTGRDGHVSPGLPLDEVTALMRSAPHRRGGQHGI